MLRGKKEVMMFVKQGSMKGDQSLPLLIVQTIGGVGVSILRCVHLDTLVFDHDQTRVYTLDFTHKLLLADGASFGLGNGLYRTVVLNMTLGSVARGAGIVSGTLSPGLQAHGWMLTVVCCNIGLIKRLARWSDGAVMISDPEFLASRFLQRTSVKIGTVFLWLQLWLYWGLWTGL
jgi:hypothetical protein